ncbi:MAG: class I SAM-dependent methyltransferase [Chloroflexota bacterium]|nr:class I SAM-dependent methyltransferase [Chloroflexota bacterium]
MQHTTHITQQKQHPQHGDRAAIRGVPSLVWRAGQERRLNLIRQWAPVDGARVLVNGCGIGMYVRALRESGAAVWGVDIERDHVQEALENAPDTFLCQAAGETLPFPDDSFDLVLSHEVIEHVGDDRAYAREMVRVLHSPANGDESWTGVNGQLPVTNAPSGGGRAVIFCPNRLYPFETHGHFWRGTYHFGNTPFINWLPNPLRNRLAPHVRAYSRGGLRRLFDGLPVRVVYHGAIFPGFDNIVRRQPELGRWLQRVTYGMELTPLQWFGISHLLVIEKIA